MGFLKVTEKYTDCLSSVLRDTSSKYISETEGFFEKVSDYFMARISENRNPLETV